MLAYSVEKKEYYSIALSVEESEEKHKPSLSGEEWSDVSIPYIQYILFYFFRGCRDRDHMVIGFTTTYAINAYRH